MLFKKIKSKKGFTLAEVLVVGVIIGILAIILFRTLATVSEIAFRVEQEKNVSQEIMNFSQILQNYADRNQIDYEKYAEGKSGFSILLANKGISTILYLSGQDGRISFYTSGNCIDPTEELLSGFQTGDCSLYLEKEGNTIEITNPKKVRLSKAIFKIIPFASQEQYLAMNNEKENNNLLYSLNAPGFRFFNHVRNAQYSLSTRGNTIHIPIQQFFTLQK